MQLQGDLDVHVQYRHKMSQQLNKVAIKVQSDKNTESQLKKNAR